MLLTLPTRVVFDGEIWIVEHLRDETEVKVVALDWVIFVRCSNSLDHLYWKQRDRKIKETGSHPLQQAAYSLHCFFATADCLSNTSWIMPDEI